MGVLRDWWSYRKSDWGAFVGPILLGLTIAAEVAMLALKAFGVIDIPWLYAIVAVPCAWVLFWCVAPVIFIIALLCGRVDMR